ncbi:MAG: hypothetical protein RQ751_03415 [Longimicrobiales bacterium]|nr:hypothetical protein [Longimicrobiales bacterium]
MALLPALAPVPGPGVAHAQERPDTVLAAGPEYAAGGLKTFLLGRNYRTLWTTPMRVPFLRLDTFAGGLAPLRGGGGFQTRSLRFLGTAGREFTFRSVNKDPSSVLDSILHGTVVDAVVQDGISASHPLGALVAPPLLEAVGVLHVTPRLAVLPDDPALGEFRSDYAGLLGMLEEHPNEAEEEGEDRSGTFGATLIVGSDRLLERLEDGPHDLLDARAYLAARLMDVFLGDWDRHRDQWRWATFQPEGVEPRYWLPIPRDRDQALSNFDGLAVGLVRFFGPEVQFVRFGADYPSLLRVHWASRELDRRFLAALEAPTWDSVATELQTRLTDAVIDSALASLPKEIQAAGNRELAAILRSRRDRIPEAARSFYRLLAQDVDIRGTEERERVVVDRTQPGSMLVTIHSDDLEAPVFRRRFQAGETEEVRLHLERGRDHVLVRGPEGSITLRIVPGRGQDSVVVEGSRKRVLVYDDGDGVTFGPGEPPHLDTRSFEEWEWSEEDRDQPRDWGSSWRPTLLTSFSTDTGVLLGGGVRWESYGFRTSPYATAVSVQGGYAPSERKGRGEITLRRNGLNSSLFVEASARGTGLRVLHFFGLGNDSPEAPRDERRVDLTVWTGEVQLGLSPAPDARVGAGMRVERAVSEDEALPFFNAIRDDLLGGRGAFHDVSFFLGGSWGVGASPREGSAAGWGSVEFSLSPPLLDVDDSFGSVNGRVGTILAPHPESALMFIVRGGGEKIWGEAPWHRNAFLGGSRDLRGWEQNRFSGDAAVFGSGEIVLRLGYPRLLLPIETGIFAFGDVGRVYLDGESPGGWHESAGGGLWFKPFRQPNTLRIGAGRSAEGTLFYASLGLPWR